MAGAARLTPRRHSSSSRLLLPPRPDDERGRQLLRVGAVPTEHRVELDDADAPLALDLGDRAFPLPAFEGGGIRLSDDRHRPSAFSIEFEVVEAGVAVTNRLAAAAAATGCRVAGRERVDGKPGAADPPVEECAESAGALFPLRPVEGGARLREQVALDLALGLAEANRFLEARVDGRPGPVVDSARA
jgi:hypothetical protein